MMLSVGTPCEWLHVAVVFVTLAMTTVNLLLAAAWLRTIRSMREVRDDFEIARGTYETAVRQLGHERRES